MAVPAPLSNRVFDSYEAIVEACCKAWNALLAEAGPIIFIAPRTWAMPGERPKGRDAAAKCPFIVGVDPHSVLSALHVDPF